MNGTWDGRGSETWNGTTNGMGKDRDKKCKRDVECDNGESGNGRGVVYAGLDVDWDRGTAKTSHWHEGT